MFEEISPSSEFIETPALVQDMSANDWNDWLLLNLFPEHHKMNFEHAGEIMKNLEDGMRYVRTELAKKGLTKTDRPPFFFLTKKYNNPAWKGVIALFSSKNESTPNHIGMRLEYLKKISKLPQDKQYYFTNPAGERVFSGTPSQWAQCVGAEEQHHAIFAQHKSGYVSPDIKIPNAQYVSHDIEYLAHKWKIRVAKNYDMPRETISLLQMRLKNAQAVRRIRYKSLYPQSPSLSLLTRFGQKIKKLFSSQS